MTYQGKVKELKQQLRKELVTVCIEKDRIKVPFKESITINDSIRNNSNIKDSYISITSKYILIIDGSMYIKFLDNSIVTISCIGLEDLAKVVDKLKTI